MTARLSPEQRERYSRQIMLPDVGPAGQARLLAGSVVVVGAGGLGSPALLYCAGAGIGTVGVIDKDRVELSNLHRQVIHTAERIGEFKTASAAMALGALNPETEIRPVPAELTGANAADLLEPYDFVISAVDSLETKFLISDTCVRLGKPFCHGGISGYEGQAFTYLPGRSAFCLRCLVPGTPPPAEPAGLFGYVPAVIGSIQAGEAVLHLAGIGAALVNRLLIFSGRIMSFRELSVRPAPDCPVCGERPSE